jgi:hypothetical protein
VIPPLEPVGFGREMLVSVDEPDCLHAGVDAGPNRGFICRQKEGGRD